jgi:hypothetical protein
MEIKPASVVPQFIVFLHLLVKILVLEKVNPRLIVFRKEQHHTHTNAIKWLMIWNVV